MALAALRGIGNNDALLPGAKPFYRDIRNRRELASMAHLVPALWASGGIDRQGRQFDAAQASDPNGPALAVSPTGQRTHPVEQELHGRPWRALADTGDCRPGPQASGGTVALCHHRLDARGRRFLKSPSRGGRKT
ncbi:MAG: hypothetical protein OXI01_13810 [Albidovulum sp.]|nr:hypothetical protein [Albidovulum sp.]